MATIEPLPELADGGFWYVFPESVEQVAGKTMRGPDIPDLAEWTGTRMDDGTYVVRSLRPLAGVNALAGSSAAKLIAAGEVSRPFGRIKGR